MFGKTRIRDKFFQFFIYKFFFKKFLFLESEEFLVQ